jgi:hypothetical protein
MHDEPDLTRPASEPIRFEAAVGGRSRLPQAVSAIGIAFLAIVLIKPWGVMDPQASDPTAVAAGVASRPAARSAGPAASARAASAPVASEQAVAAICLDPGTWRTATIEQWHPDQTVRVWRALDPRAARGPTDPSIARVPAVGETIPAIGFCAPVSGRDRPSGRAEVDAWRVEGDSASPIQLRVMAPLGAVSGLGALFAPPLDATNGWPDGVYVFRHTILATQVARWFAVEVKTDATEPRATRPPPSAVMQPGGGQGAFFLP